MCAYLRLLHDIECVTQKFAVLATQHRIDGLGVQEVAWLSQLVPPPTLRLISHHIHNWVLF